MLELAESQGLRPEFSCRGGSCGTCRTRLISGQVNYPQPPAELPGIAAYKAINTMDSMIGHLSPRHRAFGWAAARLDDVVNLIPARLTGLLFALVSPHPRASWAAMMRDAKHHRSPNAGWPEAAMAGALRVRLSGPRAYNGKIAQERWVNEAGAEPEASDLARGLRLYVRAMVLMTLGVACLVGI